MKMLRIVLPGLLVIGIVLCFLYSGMEAQPTALPDRVKALEIKVAELEKRKVVTDECRFFGNTNGNWSDPRNGENRLTEVACNSDEALRGWITGVTAPDEEVRYYCCKLKLVP